MEQLGLSTREVVIHGPTRRAGGFEHLSEGRAFNSLGGEKAHSARHHPGSDSPTRLFVAMEGSVVGVIHMNILTHYAKHHSHGTFYVGPHT